MGLRHIKITTRTMTSNNDNNNTNIERTVVKRWIRYLLLTSKSILIRPNIIITTSAVNQLRNKKNNDDEDDIHSKYVHQLILELTASSSTSTVTWQEVVVKVLLGLLVPSVDSESHTINTATTALQIDDINVNIDPATAVMTDNNQMKEFVSECIGSHFDMLIIPTSSPQAHVPASNSNNSDDDNDRELWLSTIATGHFSHMYKQKYVSSLWRPLKSAYHCHSSHHHLRTPISQQQGTCLSVLLAMNALSCHILPFIDASSSVVENNNNNENDCQQIIVIMVHALSLSCDYLFHQHRHNNINTKATTNAITSYVSTTNAVITQDKNKKRLLESDTTSVNSNSITDATIAANNTINSQQIAENNANKTNNNDNNAWMMNCHLKLLQDSLKTLQAILTDSHTNKNIHNNNDNDNDTPSFLELFSSHIHTLVPKLLMVSIAI